VFYSTVLQNNTSREPQRSREGLVVERFFQVLHVLE